MGRVLVYAVGTFLFLYIALYIVWPVVRRAMELFL